MITNTQSGTNVHEVADEIYRINTPVITEGAGGFSFNQYLVVDDQPLLFHTGPRRLFPVVREAVASVLPVEKLRYIAFSHVEADECGSLNEWLAAAPQSIPLCGSVAAMVSISDLADRAPKRSPMGSSFSWADTLFAGSTRHICRMAGTAAFWQKSAPRRCYVAICSRRAAPNSRRSRSRTSWVQARPSGQSWTISHTQSTRV